VSPINTLSLPTNETGQLELDEFDELLRDTLLVELEEWLVDVDELLVELSDSLVEL